jgi:dolichol-phosphate mannosyltransferase
VSWEVIVVDDDSPDGTAEAVRAIARADRRVRCLQRIDRRGLASACIEGMLASSASYLAVMDADMQHDETLLPHMLYLLQQGDLDLVVGSRYVATGSLGQWTGSRVWISRIATKLSHRCLRVDLTDPMSGFFMIRRETLHGVVRRLSAIGFKLLLDLLASSERPLRYKELPYVFRLRHAGESKLDSQVAWEYLLLLLDKMIGRLVPVRFIAFVVVGGLGVLVHVAVLALLFRWLRVSFLVGQTIATGIAMTSNFILNNVLTYRDRRLQGWHLVRGWLSFMLICSVGAAANVGIAAALFQRQTGWLLSALTGVLVGAVWNYALTSVYTWKHPRNTQGAPTVIGHLDGDETAGVRG